MRVHVLLAGILVVLLALLSACRRPAFLGGAPEPQGPVLCEGRYALCLAATCTPIPSWNPKTGKMETTRALCECAVANGPSLSDRPCEARAPQDEGKFLVSTFSFGEIATHPVMSCPAGGPWAYCYDQPCVVDPRDPGKAQCTCQLRTGEFQTLGGNCDKSKCGTTLWAGTTADGMASAAKLLASGEGLKAVPANTCP